MLEQIIQWDKELFLALNGCYNSFFDIVMPLLSHKLSGIPIYIGILMLIIYKYKGAGAQSTKVICIAIGAVLVTFALCDHLSVHAIKNTVDRLRPAWDPEIGDLVRLLENKGGKHGFVSTHAANLFGLATVTALLIRKGWYTWAIFIYAAAVGYSRVYVGKHFPLDVICGGLFGILVGWLVYLLALWLTRKMGLCQLFLSSR